MFIPPNGAMQFERTSSLGLLPIDEIPVFWVMSEECSPRDSCPACGNKKAFPVVVAALPQPWRDWVTRIAQTEGARVVTCQCRGKIIE
jgi:hypothetical protein